MSELANCPFCGGRAEIGGHVFAYYARCVNRDCIASTHGAHYPDAVDAVDAWNRRPAPASQDVGGASDDTDVRTLGAYGVLDRIAKLNREDAAALVGRWAMAMRKLESDADKAAAVAAAVLTERMVCERGAATMQQEPTSLDDQYTRGYNTACLDIAAAIRARKP